MSRMDRQHRHIFQQVGKQSFIVRNPVLNHHKGQAAVSRYRSEQGRDGFEAASRGTDTDDRQRAGPYALLFILIHTGNVLTMTIRAFIRRHHDRLLPIR
nr:hypothetical protein [Azospirillum sp. B510]